MESPTPINFRAAQAAMAYGGRPAPRASVGQPGTQPSSSFPQPTSRAPSSSTASRQADGSIVPPHARPVAPDQMRIGRHQDALSPTLAAMVAGQVDSPVARGEGFEAPQAAAAPRAAMGAYAMYTRAADRVEVATGLTVGRTIDARA